MKHEIKLIAADMDGTLLDGKGRLPEGFFDMLKRLEERQITFVAASGRPVATLRNNLKPASEKMTLIGDNGAHVDEAGTPIYLNLLDRKRIGEVISLCSEMPRAQAILCGVHGAYRLPHKADLKSEFDREISLYYLNQIGVEDLLSVEDDIVKIAVCDLGEARVSAGAMLTKHLGGQLAVQVSGKHWVDVMNPGVNKGAALKALQEKLDVSYDETMAFGDFYNDIELLQNAAYSFVMENANEDMKQYGAYIAESNEKYGVMKAINQWVLNDW